MKATLEFNLPDEQEDFDLCVKANKMHYALFEFDSHLRSILKYEDNLSEETYDKVQSIRDRLYDVCIENGITF